MIGRSICHAHAARTAGERREPTAPCPSATVTTACSSEFLQRRPATVSLLGRQACFRASQRPLPLQPGAFFSFLGNLTRELPWLGLQSWGCAVWQNLSFQRRPCSCASASFLCCPPMCFLPFHFRFHTPDTFRKRKSTLDLSLPCALQLARQHDMTAKLNTLAHAPRLFVSSGCLFKKGFRKR